MAEILTKSRARNIFYGGSIFFVVVFVAMTVHSHRYVVQTSTAGMPLSEEVVHGKHVWEEHSCINCHSLHGEGAYFAPELGNVTTRWGVQDSPDDAFWMLKGWIESQPSGIEGRRQMPRYDLSDEDIRALSEFLRWADQTDTQGWPPNDAG
ncbi:c-type cytochrome [Roseovarius indicus]|jgi:nitric oxide reductase subunit C|uniref:Cytochrome C n=1 Tax=Roseovarius indicus TaxID=540747 RepID=A0A0T5PAQ6_9RHOB|nr:cytochrome c [Roseovarius indicus]KRS18031.1 cytochrome C [Roseovarius indicus]OAO02760.1 cytochrome C [Roseovarius indicus]QEW27145.1 Nitric oxide reductase cytochrome c subunit [Roseovarius indicus]SFD53373.1 nitric oxide reductase, NorC subunit apoprotein [Roseovarius indicus]